MVTPAKLLNPVTTSETDATLILPTTESPKQNSNLYYDLMIDIASVILSGLDGINNLIFHLDMLVVILIKLNLHNQL